MEDGTYMSESSGEVQIMYLKDDLGDVDTFTFGALKNVLMQIEKSLRETESWDDLIVEITEPQVEEGRRALGWIHLHGPGIDLMNAQMLQQRIDARDTKGIGNSMFFA